MLRRRFAFFMPCSPPPISKAAPSRCGGRAPSASSEEQRLDALLTGIGS